MQVELHIQPGLAAEFDWLAGYARRAVQLHHPALVKILEVGVDATGRVVLVTPGAAGCPADLRQVITTTTDPATACSIALTLAEALAVLHRDQFRGGLSLSWGDCVRAVRSGDGTWHLALFPPIPAHIILAERPAGFAGVARFGAPELFATAATLPTPASDSFSLGALLFELLTGKPALQPGSLRELVADLLDGRFRRVADFRPDLPGALGEFVSQALGREPGSRPSLAVWALAMQSFGGRLLSPPPPPAEAESPPSPAARGEGPSRVSLKGILGGDYLLEMPSPPVTGGFGGVRADLSYQEGLGMDEVPLSFSIDAGAEVKGLVRGVGAPGQVEGVAEAPEPVTPIPAAIALNATTREAPQADVDPVDCTVFAPPAAAAGESILVQVFVHMPAQADDAILLARAFDEGSRRLGFRSLEVDVPRGTQLQIELSLPGLDVDEPVQRVTWRGRATAVQFAVQVPPAREPGRLIGKVGAYLEGTPIGHIRFQFEVLAAGQSRLPSGPRPAGASHQELDAHSGEDRRASRPLGDEARRYTQAFISYAMRDLDEVMKRVQMLPRVNITFFQDLLSLEPGERWERKLYERIDDCDVFMLFWSTAAKESKWVRKEVEYALGRKGGDDSRPPEIVPILIEGPPVPLPPPELAHLHFNDRLLYYMTRPKAG
jgi:hypothetical protein